MSKSIIDFGNFTARKDGVYYDIAKSVNKCVFCDLREKYIVCREKGWVLTVNIFPYIDGQVLVMPEKHLENLDELSLEDVKTSHNLIKKSCRLLEKKLNIKNIWIILRQGEFSGKTVKHLHWNVMPYIEGINTWHYQNISIEPIKLAKLLREEMKK